METEQDLFAVPRNRHHVNGTRTRRKKRNGKALEIAKLIVLDALSAGPMMLRDLRRLAERKRIHYSTLLVALKEVGVIKEGSPRRTIVRLPGGRVAPVAKSAPERKPQSPAPDPIASLEVGLGQLRNEVARLRDLLVEQIALQESQISEQRRLREVIEKAWSVE